VEWIHYMDPLRWTVEWFATLRFVVFGLRYQVRSRLKSWAPLRIIEFT
jgi:hypothetical protein